MRLQDIEITGFKSFAKKSTLSFTAPVTAVVGPNGSGKSNVVEAFRFVLGEQSIKSMRGKSGADLLFRGGPGTSKLSRAAVSITFDNKDKVFSFGAPQFDTDSTKSPLLFDTITFTRELFADGTSKYSMNGAEIKLRQMIELLSSVNIGTSSHHIISQGEADGILRASPRDRREMIEDALGLKIYHYRIKESESKLAKALDALKDVQSLRREIVPHLKFLQKQVEKIEKGRAIRTELEGVLVHYLATEKSFLSAEDERIINAQELITTKKLLLETTLTTLPEEVTISHDSTATERSTLATTLREIRDNRRTLEGKISRLEGMVEAHRQMMVRAQAVVPAQSAAVSFAATEYEQLLGDIEFFLESMRSADSIEKVRATLATLEGVLFRLKSRENKPLVVQPQESISHDTLKDTALEMEELQKELAVLLSQEEEYQLRIQTLETLREQSLVTNQETTRKRYEVSSDIKQCASELQILAVSKNAFLERKEYFDTELKEAAFLFGPSFIRTLQATDPIPELPVHDTKRTIDRLKIRLDEHSGIGNEVVGEYESTKERDEFLAREVADSEASIRNLESLIMDLKKILDEKFTTGVTVINERFAEFFKTMFGGGSAFLSVTVEKKRRKKTDEILADIDEEVVDETDDRFFERGIDVHVNLPEKKVKELQMLSGGERSLVSIALLFAISQVNPPPFLVLDETDAALDEANSRRYGDMIEKLSAYSQLIVVTHNRETMSRATVLYGVTLGADSASKLLSIKFDDAVKVAK